MSCRVVKSSQITNCAALVVVVVVLLLLAGGLASPWCLALRIRNEYRCEMGGDGMPVGSVELPPPGEQAILRCVQIINHLLCNTVQAGTEATLDT